MLYNATKIEIIWAGLTPLYSVRQCGVAIGFGSSGGNLSHHVRGRYGLLFVPEVHFLPGPSAPPNAPIYMRSGPLLLLLGLVAMDEPRWRDRVISFMDFLVNDWGYA